MKHFFDIGANVGQTFDYLATLDRDFTDYKFWLFEPSPRHIPKLLEKCSLAQLRYSITVCPFGIGSESKQIKLFEKDDVLGDSFYSWHKSDHAPTNLKKGFTIVPSVVGINDVISGFTLPGDEIVLDIDAEGSEYEILAALMDAPQHRYRVKEIWVEWHKLGFSPNITPAMVTEWCAFLGIKITHRGLQNLS